MDDILERSPKKLSRFWRLGKEGCFVVGGQVGVVLLNLLLVRILTECINPGQFGALTLALSIGTLICQVAFSGSMPGIFRYYSIAAEANDVYAYFKASRRLMFYGLMIAMGLTVVLLFGAMFQGETHEWQIILVVASLFSILLSYNSVFSMIQNAARQREIVALHGVLQPALRVLLLMALVFFAIKANALWVIGGYLLALMIVLSSQTFFLRRLIPKAVFVERETVAHWIRQIWSYSKPFVMFNLFTWVSSYSDRWALATFASTREVGLYAVLLQLGYTPITMANGLMMTFMTPILFQRAGTATDHTRVSGVRRLILQLTLSILGLTVVGFILTWMFHDTIFRLFVDVEYQEVSYLLPWLIVGGGVFSAGQILTEKLQCGLNSQALVAPKIVSAVVGAGLNFLCVYMAGLPGAIMGMIVSAMFYLLWISLTHDRLTT